MDFLIPCSILLLATFGTLHVNGEVYKASVYIKKGEVTFAAGKYDPDATAYGFFNDTLFQTGWGELQIKAGHNTDSSVSGDDVMFAAGALEGLLTAKHISTHYENIFSTFFKSVNDSGVQKVKDYFNKQQKWSNNMQTKYKSKDPYWRHASYINSQLYGLYAGYKHAAETQSIVKPDIFIMQLLNAAGDMIDLQHALGIAQTPDYSHMTREELLQTINLQGHCSALVKITGALENIFMSHSSWFVYSATNRIYKYYDFNVKDTSMAASSVSFSSYPGFLESLDDFYIMSSNLVMLQTTNNIFNQSLYDYVTPESLLAWQRVRIANNMATSGSHWSTIFAKYNSGTYNNQYMVIDLSKIHLGQRIDDDALWVVEQVPSLVIGADQTPILRAGYWPSYNVPFYEAIYNISGYPDFVVNHGSDFSYQMAPRAKIFRRDQATVTDMASMKRIMRYNDYEHDPYSEGMPCNSICCRADLDAKNPRPLGCYDSKVADYSMALKQTAYAINGPTLGTGLKPFSWTGIFANSTHKGLPETYEFDWLLMTPRNL